MARKLEGEAARGEALRIRETRAWPAHPLLPIKRRRDGSEGDQLAVICAGDVETGQVRVFDVSIDRISATAIDDAGRGGDLGLALAGVYPCVEALVDAGWMGD
jgi:hypothetical protein